MGNNFHRDFSRKIIAVLCVVCEGIQSLLNQQPTLYETLDVGLHVGPACNCRIKVIRFDINGPPGNGPYIAPPVWACQRASAHTEQTVSFREV